MIRLIRLIKYAVQIASLYYVYEANIGHTYTTRTQLSQTDRATLRIIKYIAKSLKCIGNGTIRKLG